MPIDLYLAGRTSSEMDDFFFTHGCDHLFSQLHERRGINEWVDRTKEQGKAGKLFIDSGAYSAYTKGKELDVDDYINYVNELDEYIEIFVQVDKIPGQHGKPKTLEDILEAPKISWENYNYMRDKVKSPDKLLPVFHRREDFKWLRLMLETRFHGAPIPYIGIAATTDSTVKEKKNWFEQVFDVIRKSSNKDVLTHAFGMTSFKLLESYPWKSADSTSWIQTGANGAIQTKWGPFLISNWQEHDPTNLIHWGEEGKEVLAYIESFGFSIPDLSARAQNRWKFNGLTFTDWARNIHQYRGGQYYRRRLF